MDRKEHLASNSRLPNEWLKRYTAFGGYFPNTAEGRKAECALVRKAQAGDEDATYELVARNFPAILTLVKKFTVPGIPADDRVQTAILGFIKGIMRYDLNREYKTKLYAYAIYWADQAMQELTPMAHTLKIPHNIVSAMSRFRRSGLSEPENLQYASARNVRAAMLLSGQHVSLDCPVRGSGAGRNDKTIGDVIADTSTVTTDELEDAIDIDRRAERVKKAMSKCLTEREIDIMMRRMNDETLEDIGARYKLSRERIRQIELECILRIRAALEGRNYEVDRVRRIARQGGRKSIKRSEVAA